MYREEEILEIINKEKVHFIKMYFTDIEGMFKSFTITPNHVKSALRDGIGFDGSSIKGFGKIEKSDFIAMPDRSTFKVLPKELNPSLDCLGAMMICDILNTDRTPFVGDPRYILKTKLKKLKDEKNWIFNVGPELEFYYFKNRKTPEIVNNCSYFDTSDSVMFLRQKTVDILLELGIPVELSHPEVGPGQQEIDVKYGPALQVADNCQIYKEVVKQTAESKGYYASFMPKPMFGKAGSGMHIHQSLFEGKKNIFFDKDGEYYLSETAKSYIAGVLKYAKEITGICNQHINSYKRLIPGYEAPVYISWSNSNRSALIRVPAYGGGSENGTRIEFRSPDPSCNPYLAFSVMLEAGMDGIENRLKVEEPLTENIYEYSGDKELQTLPCDLFESIQYMKQSDLVKEAIGEHVFSRFINLKERDWKEYSIQVTQFEIDTLFPLL